jgi:hypothetical protein
VVKLIIKSVEGLSIKIKIRIPVEKESAFYKNGMSMQRIRNEMEIYY